MSHPSRNLSKPARQSRVHVASAVAVAVLSALSCQVAIAQAAKELTKEEKKTQLETITVTAERRAENIKDVPIAITTLGGEKLDVINSGGQDIRMLSARIPSLNIESSFGRAFPRFYIRGFGNTDFDLNASQPVSLVYDDIVQENALLKGFPVFDMQQVEVLRGPQGTMFGRNTPAGVIKFDSVKTSQLQDGYLNLSYGRHNATNVEGAYGTAINSDWSVRLSVQLQNRDSFVNNTIKGPTDKREGYTDQAARFQALYEPSKQFSALFNVHAREMDGSARLFRANIIKKGSNDLVDNFKFNEISIDGANSSRLSNLGSNLRMKWTLDSGLTVHSITGVEALDSFNRGDIDGGYGASFIGTFGPGFIPFPAESADALPKHNQFSQEFRIESDAKGPIKWIGGAYYFDEDITIDSFNYDSLGGGVQNGFASQRQKNKAMALFGSANFKVSDQLNVRGGLRYTSDKKDFVAKRFVSPFGAGATPEITAKPSDKDVSWDLSATYALDKSTNVYGRLSRGFRAPSIQGRVLFGDGISVANSEKVTSFEAGVKTDLFNKRARLSANVFRYEVRDAQLTAVGGQTNFNRLINAAKMRGQGAEFDLEAIITENLLATVGGSINNTEILDSGLVTAACGGGCTVLDPAGPVAGTFNINGNALPQAPKYVANFTLKYTMPLSSSSEFFVYTDWAYRSKVNFFLYESKEFIGKSLMEGGLRAGYLWDNGKYEVAAFSRNVGNQIRVVGGIDFNNLTGFVNEPRTYGIQFKAKF